ncbi:trans-sialidase, putative, partial [Trypanosoma cruzi marinkellei]
MHSRVAAVKAPRTHNRRCVTGSSGRRREGGESERQRPNMSRRVFASVVLFIVVVMMCCGTGGAADAVASKSVDEQSLQRIDLFVPNQTLVLPKKGTASETKSDSFVSPSLVSAGGVIAAFAEGHINAQYTADGNLSKPISSDVVAGYLDAKWNWSALVGKVNSSTWKAHSVLSTTDATNNNLVGVFYNPTTTTKGNKVFLLAGSLGELKGSGEQRKRENLGLKLVVGDVREPTGSESTVRIDWAAPTSLLNESTKTA